MTVSDLTPKQATKVADRLFADLVNAVNGLAEVDWSAVLDADPTPDASMVRMRSMVTLVGMMAHVCAAMVEPTEVLLAGMTEAALAEVGGAASCPACLVELPGDHEQWCPHRAAP
jgi:hypothetical protein